MARVKDRLLEIQSAFMSLLGDGNDLVQDAASKGLGLVYDSSSEEQRSKMVSSLLSTLTEGKKEVQKVILDCHHFIGWHRLLTNRSWAPAPANFMNFDF